MITHTGEEPPLTCDSLGFLRVFIMILIVFTQNEDPMANLRSSHFCVQISVLGLTILWIILCLMVPFYNRRSPSQVCLFYRPRCATHLE